MCVMYMQEAQTAKIHVYSNLVSYTFFHKILEHMCFLLANHTTLKRLKHGQVN